MSRLLRNTLKELESKSKELESKSKQQFTNIQEHNESLESYHNQIHQCYEEISCLKQENCSQQQKNCYLQQELSDLRKQISERDEEAHRMKRKVSELEEHCVHQDALNGRLKKMCNITIKHSNEVIEAMMQAQLKRKNRFTELYGSEFKDRLFKDLE